MAAHKNALQVVRKGFVPKRAIQSGKQNTHTKDGNGASLTQATRASFQFSGANKATQCAVLGLEIDVKNNTFPILHKQSDVDDCFNLFWYPASARIWAHDVNTLAARSAVRKLSV